MTDNRKWLPKPEILISLKLWETPLKFQQYIFGSRPCRARGNCPWAIATTIDKQKWQYRRFGHQSRHFGLSVVVAITWLHFCQARHGRKSRICRWISTLSVTVPERYSYFRFWWPYRNFRLSLADTFFDVHVESRGRKPQICRWNFNDAYHSFSISGFGCHFRLSAIIETAHGHSSKTYDLPLLFWWYLSYFRRYK